MPTPIRMPSCRIESGKRPSHCLIEVNHCDMRTVLGTALSDEVMRNSTHPNLFPNCLNQSSVNQRDQPSSRIKTGVDFQSGLGYVADRVAFGDGFAKCGLCWVQ